MKLVSCAHIVDVRTAAVPGSKLQDRITGSINPRTGSTTHVYQLGQLAARWGISPSTIASDITRNPTKLPPFIRLGRAIRFPIAEVEASGTAATHEHPNFTLITLLPDKAKNYDNLNNTQH